MAIGGLKLNLANDFRLLGHRCFGAHRFVTKDAEEAAEKRLQRQEVALKAAQQAHASCEDTILALQQQLDDALREKSDNSTLSRTSVSPPPPMAPPPPGALAAARLRCGKRRSRAVCFRCRP